MSFDEVPMKPDRIWPRVSIETFPPDAMPLESRIATSPTELKVRSPLPLFTGDKNDYTWIKDVVAQCCDGVKAKIGWHFCFGNAWGNDILSASFPEGYQTVLPHFFDTPGIDQFVLDYANRNMAGIEFMKNLPKNKDVQIGVLDIRNMMIEKPAQIADRIRTVLKYVDADRLYPSTDCGMKPLARMVAKMKLQSLAEGAAIVRKEVGA